MFLHPPMDEDGPIVAKSIKRSYPPNTRWVRPPLNISKIKHKSPSPVRQLHVKRYPLQLIFQFLWKLAQTAVLLGFSGALLGLVSVLAALAAMWVVVVLVCVPVYFGGRVRIFAKRHLVMNSTARTIAFTSRITSTSETLQRTVLDFKTKIKKQLSRLGSGSEFRSGIRLTSMKKMKLARRLVGLAAICVALCGFLLGTSQIESSLCTFSDPITISNDLVNYLAVTQVSITDPDLDYPGSRDGGSHTGIRSSADAAHGYQARTNVLQVRSLIDSYTHATRKPKPKPKEQPHHVQDTDAVNPPSSQAGLEDQLSKTDMLSPRSSPLPLLSSMDPSLSFFQSRALSPISTSMDVVFGKVKFRVKRMLGALHSWILGVKHGYNRDTRRSIDIDDSRDYDYARDTRTEFDFALGGDAPRVGYPTY